MKQALSVMWLPIPKHGCSLCLNILFIVKLGELGKDIQIVPMDNVEKRHISHLAFTQSETLLWVYELITS